jgi:hypothetical protein
LKKCREEGSFPGVNITEIEAILKAKEKMEMVKCKIIFTKLLILTKIIVIL